MSRTKKTPSLERSDTSSMEAEAFAAYSECPELTSVQISNLAFDLQIVLDGFHKCKQDDGQLFLDGYIRAYNELNKFLQILGTVFNFVANDVQKKITILQCYRKGGAGDLYYSIQSMIEYEQEHNLLRSKDQQSGSRTLLRLHRALEFITAFLLELNAASMESGMGAMTSEIYSKTLAKYHGWMLSKTVGTVLLMMPTKQTISDRVSGGNELVLQRNVTLMPQAIEIMNSVYNLTQKLYEDYEILDLP